MHVRLCLHGSTEHSFISENQMVKQSNIALILNLCLFLQFNMCFQIQNTVLDWY